MKLSYNVLCIDNDIPSLARVKDAFIALNSELGIEVFYHDIEVKPSAREALDAFKLRIMQALTDQFTSSTFDLILVDLHMEGGVNGQDIISAIRESHSIYRPIIFYSAGNPPADDTALSQLNEEAKKADILGKSIFITSRGNLEQLLQNIAEEMHQEEHKINHVRGLLMDQVSELDANIIKIIATSQIWDSVPNDKRDSVVKKFKERMSSKLKSTNDVHESTKDMDYDAIKKFILDNPRAVDTFNKGKILREMLRHITKYQAHGETLSLAISDDENSLLNIRNKYGHSTANDLKTGHDDTKCKHIREESRKHVKNIKEVSGN